MVVVPTYNPGSIWLDCVHAIIEQTARPSHVLVIDSGSKDNTVDIAVDAGFRVLTIDKAAFNHGGTRQSALEERVDCDYVVFLTQDAVLADAHAFGNMLQYFEDESIAAVCGRQLPRKGAGAIESHARLFNYPERSFTRSMKDAENHGLKTAFISNSFAAYRIDALLEVGGFPVGVIFGEDMYVAAKALLAGYKIAYAGDACVYHSHNYSPMQEMRRYFDMGVFHEREPWIKKEFGGAEKEGIKFMLSEFAYLLHHAFWRIPEAFLRAILRYVGFRLGLLEKRMPLKIKKKISMNAAFFNNPGC